MLRRVECNLPAKLIRTDRTTRTHGTNKTDRITRAHVMGHTRHKITKM